MRSPPPSSWRTTWRLSRLATSTRCRAKTDLPAINAKRAYDRYGPYLLPRIKGTFALHQLRLLLGNEVFFEVMSTTHDRFRGTEMTTLQFIEVAEEVSGKVLTPFVRQWLDRTGLPRPVPSVEVEKVGAAAGISS